MNDDLNGYGVPDTDAERTAAQPEENAAQADTLRPPPHTTPPEDAFGNPVGADTLRPPPRRDAFGNPVGTTPRRDAFGNLVGTTPHKDTYTSPADTTPARSPYGTYANPPYNTGGTPVNPRNPAAGTPPQPVRPTPVKPTSAADRERRSHSPRNRRRRFANLVLIALLCLVVGGASGAVSSLFVMRNYEPPTQPSTAPTAAPLDIFSPTAAPTPTEPPAEGATDEASTAVPISTASAVYRDNVDSVVCISGKGYKTINYGFFFGSQTQEFISSGSGFFLSADGYILTNYHVVEGCESYSVTDYNGDEYTAVLIGYEESNDIAVLKVEGDSFQPVALGDSSDLQVGDALMIIGNALGELQYTLTTGVVSFLKRQVTTETGTVINMFQTDAAINTGNSGGPVFNDRGMVIGIASAKYASSSIEGLGFCIPVNDVKDMISDIVSVGYVTGKPSIGVSLYTNTGSGRNGLPVGCYVVAVGENTAAAKAGIREGDVITAADGRTVRDVDDVASVLSAFSAGDTLSLTYYRDGGSTNVSVTLDERSSEIPRTEYTNVFDY